MPEPFEIGLGQRARRAYGPWLRGHANWSLFIAVTMREEVSRRRFVEATLRFLRICARDVAGAHFKFALGFGRQPQRGVFHGHFLFAHPITDLQRIRHSWIDSDQLAGNADVQPYREGKGAPEYLARHEEVVVGVACPRLHRCRRRGVSCAVAGAPVGLEK